MVDKRPLLPHPGEQIRDCFGFHRDSPFFENPSIFDKEATEWFRGGIIKSCQSWLQRAY
jgi:hypothetical protein